MYELLGFVTIILQLRGTVVVFGGHDNAPQRLKIIIGIGQILFFAAFLMVANGM